MIETPVQVAEDVQRVWTGLLNYSAKEDDITDMEEFGNDYVDNTIIEKNRRHILCMWNGCRRQKCGIAAIL